MNEPIGKDWMDELKGGSISGEPVKENIAVSGSAMNPSAFHGTFKFCLGEKVYSRIHEAKGIVEYSEMTRFISGDQISYKVRFNDPEEMKTDAAMIDEEWLDKV